MSAIVASCRALARVRRFYAVRRARLLVRRTADGGRRYTARSAADAVGKKTTFRDRAGRTGHVGRQYTPVVRTPVKNHPSNRGSRAIRARSHVLHSRSNASRLTAAPSVARAPTCEGRRGRPGPKTARHGPRAPVRSRASMRERYFYGWNVVASAFVVGLFAFGLGFYG